MFLDKVLYQDTSNDNQYRRPTVLGFCSSGQLSVLSTFSKWSGGKFWISSYTDILYIRVFSVSRVHYKQCISISCKPIDRDLDLKCGDPSTGVSCGPGMSDRLIPYSETQYSSLVDSKSASWASLYALWSSINVFALPFTRQPWSQYMSH